MAKWIILGLPISIGRVEAQESLNIRTPDEVLQKPKSLYDLNRNLMTDQYEDGDDLMMEHINNANYADQNRILNNKFCSPNKSEIPNKNQGKMIKTPIGKVFIPNSLPINGLRVK